jgi:hypothetical protein
MHLICNMEVQWTHSVNLWYTSGLWSPPTTTTTTKQRSARSHGRMLPESSIRVRTYFRTISSPLGPRRLWHWKQLVLMKPPPLNECHHIMQKPKHRLVHHTSSWWQNSTNSDAWQTPKFHILPRRPLKSTTHTPLCTSAFLLAHGRLKTMLIPYSNTDLFTTNDDVVSEKLTA